MLVTKSVKRGSFMICLKVMENYNRLITNSGYSFLYSLCLFALFFPHRLHRFSIRLTVVLIFGN